MLSRQSPPGSVLLLHGASSAGKSTLARVILDLAPHPLLHLSIDTYRDAGALPMERFRTGDFDWSHSRNRIFKGFHASVAGFAGAGNNIVLEHILDDPELRSDFEEALGGFAVFRVGLHTPLADLEQRADARQNRSASDAALDFAVVHSGMIYDMEVDGTENPVENAKKILRVWA